MKNQKNFIMDCDRTIRTRINCQLKKITKNRYNQNGITLIALVITIILLLILAGVVINLTLGEHGILKQAEQSSEKYKISEILEKLELEKVDLYTRKNGEIPSTKEYIDHLISKGIITVDDVLEIDSDTKNIVVDGYLFEVEKEQGGNIKITNIGKDDGRARIAKIQVTKTTINSISVNVITANVNGGTYKYSIKNVTTGETSFTTVATETTNEYTFVGLVENNEYIIQVEVMTDQETDIKETEIIKAEFPKVKIITLDKTTINMYTRTKEKITADVKPEESIDKTITWTSSNEAVATVDNTGVVTAVGNGVAIITATSNEVNTVTAICNITVTTPPPPTAGVGAETHTAKQIPYNWEELNTIAQVISENYGTEEGKINNNTAEVNVSVNGKSDVLGIGDYTTVNGCQVRILGFNHDELVNKAAYGENTNVTYAGISFEYVDFIMGNTRIISPNSVAGGWANFALRGTLNGTLYNGVKGIVNIKQVKKPYCASYASDALSYSQDYLWLLSGHEVWGGVGNTGIYAYRGQEGTQYKYYKTIGASAATGNNYLKKPSNIVGSSSKRNRMVA